MAVYKFSNVGGFGTYQRYNDFLAGNPTTPVVTDFGAYFPLGEFTLASAQSSITFSNIPQTYKHLQIRGIAKSTGAGSQDLQVGFNGNTSNYAFHALYSSNGTSTLASAATAQSYMKLAYNFTVASSVTNSFGAIVIDILDYTSTNKTKVFRALGGCDNNGSGTLSLFSGFHSTTTSAITSIVVRPEADNFAINSNFALYGVLA